MGKADIKFNQALLHWLNDLADRGIVATDANLKIISWNRWLEIHSGLSARQVIGRDLFDVYPQLIERRLDRFYHQALGGQVAILSQRLHHYLLPMSPTSGSGESSQMLQSARIMPLTENGEVVGTITVIEDVTERVLRETELQRQIQQLERTEAALRSTQARLQHLLSSSPVVIYTRQPNQDYTLTFISDNITERLGYKPEEFLENSSFWLELVHPEDAHYFGEEISRLMKQGHNLIEYRFRHKDGSYRWICEQMKLICNPAGEVEEIVGTIHDISDRKIAQEQIREQAALLDIATDAIFVRDLENRILFWNKGAENLYGWKVDEALGKKFDQLLPNRIINITSKTQQEADKIVLEKGFWEGELCQVTKDGKEVIVSSRWTLVRDRTGKPKSILAVNTDITEKKQLEAQFLRAQRLESIGTLASGIAHDLNNILTPILGAVKLLEFELPAEKRRQLLDMIENNTLRGADLIKQVLSFAKGLEGQHTLVQIKHLIEEIKVIIRETFPKSIEFNTDIPSEIWPIYGEPTQLHQIFMNLCVNARDAMPDGGILTISARNIYIDSNYVSVNLDAKIGNYVVLSVSDTGKGIEPEILEKIFEPFFTTKEVGKGTGLGLSTVRGIVKNHGGFIRVYSQVGKGSEFKIYLPAAETAEIKTESEVELSCGNGELILVVDDEATVREIAQVILQKYNYQVLTASDGMEALTVYAQHQDKIRAVLLDLMMPCLDGKNTICGLRKINPNVKIIAVSGLSAKGVAAEAMSLGAINFLPKPYTTRELLKALQEACKS